MKAYRGSGSTAPSILKCGTRLWWVVLLQSPVTLLLKVATPHWKGGCIGLTASLDALQKRKISCPCRKFYHDSLSFNPQTTKLHYTDYTNLLFSFWLHKTINIPYNVCTDICISTPWFRWQDTLPVAETLLLERLLSEGLQKTTLPQYMV